MVDIENMLLQGKTIQIRPEGYSMYPMLIPKRDEAIIEPVEITDIRRGDVILYRREGSILVLHRVFKIKDSNMYLVGDNQERVEGPLPLSCARGRLTAFIRDGRHISVKNPVYRFFACVWLRIRPFRGCIKRPIAYIKRKKR